MLLHFCSLFDSEQENTLLVPWSKDSFKKCCFEPFLGSDPAVYWAFKAVIRQNRPNTEFGGYDLPNRVIPNKMVTCGLLRCYLSLVQILKHAMPVGAILPYDCLYGLLSPKMAGQVSKRPQNGPF